MTLDAHGNARRRLLVLGAGLAGGVLGNGLVAGKAEAALGIARRSSHPQGGSHSLGGIHPPGGNSLPGERALSFDNLHTGERLRTVYWCDGHYLPAGQKEIDWVLRDFRANQVHPIDPAVLDLLHALQNRLECRGPFEIISGYRTAKTNAMLAASTEGVARHSLHMSGMAVDIRLARVPLMTLHRAAVSLRAGGVGLYRASDFVHVDVGRVRYW